MSPPPPRPTLFPYTTLFRSRQSNPGISGKRTPAELDMVPKEEAIPTCLLGRGTDRKSTRLNSSHLGISYAVFCLKKKKKKIQRIKTYDQPHMQNTERNTRTT